MQNSSLKATAFLVRLVLTCVDSAAKSASPPSFMISSAFFYHPPPSVLSVFPIGCAKWPLIPALVTAAKFRRESASRVSIWPRRLVPLVAHAAALLSRVTIWSPHSHKLTRDFISLVTFFPDRIVLVLIPTFFIGTSTLLGLTSLFKFCRRFRSHSQLRSNSVFTMQTISVASINRKLGSVT